MISRILVPIGARPPVDATTQRRRPTTMDERTLVPAMLPIVRLDGNSKIPTDLPLESIAARVVVPRDVRPEAYRVQEDASIPLQPTEMDARIAVPVGAAPPPIIEPMAVPPPTDLVDPDVFLTGEVHLAAPEQKEETAKWQLTTRASSVLFHILVLAVVLLQSKIFPPRQPTEQEIALANRQLTWIPPESTYSVQPRSQPRPTPPAPAVRVDPRVLRRV